MLSYIEFVCMLSNQGCVCSPYKGCVYALYIKVVYALHIEVVSVCSL